MSDVHFMTCFVSNTTEAVPSKCIEATVGMNAAFKSCYCRVVRVGEEGDKYQGDCLQFDEDSSEYLRRYSKRLWMSLGLITWKARLICERLKEISENDILLYHDYDSERYSAYNSNLRLHSSRYRELIENSDMVLFTEGYKPIGMDVSSYHVDLYRNIMVNTVLPKTGLWAGALLVRNNARTRAFMEGWISATRYELLIRPLRLDKEDGNMQAFSGEQSLLTMLYWSRISLESRTKIRLVKTKKRLIPGDDIKAVVYEALHVSAQFRQLVKECFCKARRRNRG